MPDAYREYVEQIDGYRQLKDAESLAKVREEFSAEFPLLPSIWLSWIR